ncbi:unnamed protein product [Eruca vesicaria subsp. sativa]|uniref:Uncharacterized protein n=1 Tax=Eruca vesicaria subsp. sativa TaxID=29727 RepID=A0ABC8KRR5_ERUVS|nr:unnamed protein product [Eruca vesicaria subsp. sativa]
MWLDLLMVDVNATMMHASINASHVGVFRAKLTAGNINESVTLSFFDAEAVAFHHRLDKMRIDPKVIVATSINPKMVGG